MISPSQSHIIDQIYSWFKDPKKKQYLTLGGFAGTGKTTLIGELSKYLKGIDKDLNIAFCSYTGKAVRVLGQKLSSADAIGMGDSVSTIHQLIYEPIENDRGDIVGWKRKKDEEFTYGLIIVDEASMLNQSIWNDLIFYDIPILAVGDHGQLPPIEGQFNLMENPQLKLETIYRQESGNPIIEVSRLARERGIIPYIEFSKNVKKMKRSDPDTQDFLRDILMQNNEEQLVLVGFNNTRVKLNKAVRELIGFESPLPEVRDRVICLRNNHTKRIYNGMTGQIKQIELINEENSKYYKSTIEFDDEKLFKFDGLMSYEQFGATQTLHENKNPKIDLFDFGYALTVHKAQGSQAKTVILFEERSSYMDDITWKRWLYTGITRASENLYIIGNA